MKLLITVTDKSPSIQNVGILKQMFLLIAVTETGGARGLKFKLLASAAIVTEAFVSNAHMVCDFN